jgi:hypothetical protein
MSEAARIAEIGWGTAHKLLKPVATALDRPLVTWHQMTDTLRSLRRRGSARRVGSTPASPSAMA